MFFSDQSYRPRKDEVVKQSQLINHLPIDRLTLFGVTHSLIHALKLIEVTTRGFAALQVCSHDDFFSLLLKTLLVTRPLL